MNFERPIMNAASVKAMQSLVEYQGADNIWFCGAHVVYGICCMVIMATYYSLGVPLLENAVKSGMYVAKRLGCEVCHFYCCVWCNRLIGAMGGNRDTFLPTNITFTCFPAIAYSWVSTLCLIAECDICLGGCLANVYNKLQKRYCVYYSSSKLIEELNFVYNLIFNSAKVFLIVDISFVSAFISFLHLSSSLSR